MTCTAIVSVTAEIIADFYGAPPARSMRAFAGLADGVPLAIFGLYYDTGRMILFADIKPEARSFKKTLVRGALKVAELARSLNVPVHAVAGCADGSARLLKRLGFTQVGDIFILGDA